MRNYLNRLAVAGLVMGPVLLVTPPAAGVGGYSPGCVTEREYANVHEYQTKAKVHDVFDTKGRLVDSLTFEEGRDSVRSYRKCAGFDDGKGRVGVNFDNYTAAHVTGQDVSGMRFFRAVRNSPSRLIWWD